MSSEQQSTGSTSCVFMVRLWPEAMDGSTTEPRAEVRHVQSGEIRYFRNWESLTDFLAEKACESANRSPMLQPING
jgi:hypothetical protein